MNEIMNPEPQTLALGMGLAFVLIFAVYRRGQNAGGMSEPYQKWAEEELDLGLETVEPVVESVVEEDDDLELLEELEEL